jgi:hypothetical protein
MAAAFAVAGVGSAAIADWETVDDVAFGTTVEATTRGVASLVLEPGGGRLYAVTLMGEIHRWRIDPQTGALSGQQTLAPPEFQDADGPRGLIGAAFDPADPSVLWVTDNYPVALSGANERRPDFSGRVSRLRLDPGDAFTARAEVYLRGLPRSCGDHLSNSLAFRAGPDASAAGPGHLLYLSQGSNSAMGAADRSWCYRPERLLSAAILEIDPRRDPPPGGFDVATEPLPADGGNRRFGYSWTLGRIFWPKDDGVLSNDGIPIDSGPQTGAWLHFDDRGVAAVRAGPERGDALIAPGYDPFAPDAPVRIFATGVRNGYDLVWHSNGWLYVPSNGPVAGGALPDDPRTPLDESVAKVGRGPDFLLRLRRGDYAGHANPLRGEFIAHGGNPTAGPDPNEVSSYPVGVQPDPRYRPEQAYDLDFHWSPNGAVEYRGARPGSALEGALIVVNFSKGNNLRAFTFDGTGAVAADFTLRDPEGAEITYSDPLDVIEGPGGRLYLSTLERSNGRSLVVRLDPALVVLEKDAQ